MKKKYLFSISAVFFLLFLVFTYFVAREYLNQVDFDTTVRVQNNVPVRVDPFFSSFSLVGSFEVATVLFGIFLLAVSWKKWRRIIMGVPFVLFHAVELIFKTIIDQVGPPFMFHRYALDYHFPSSYISTDYFSYPSGHVGRTAFLVFVLGFVIWKSKLNKLLKYGFIGGLGVIYIIMFVSRVALGEHWVSDVIGGSLLGFSMAATFLVLW